MTGRTNPPALRPGPFALRTNVFDLQRDRLRPAVVRLRQRKVDRRFEILPALLKRRPAPRRLPPPDPRKERIEEVGEPAGPRSGLRPLAKVERLIAVLRPVRPLLLRLLRSPLPIHTEHVVLLTLLGISKNFISLLNILEFLFSRLRIIRIRIRMPLPRQLAISRLNVFLSRRLLNAKNLIVVFIIHSKGAPPQAPRPPRGFAARGPRMRAASSVLLTVRFPVGPRNGAVAIGTVVACGINDRGVGGIAAARPLGESLVRQSGQAALPRGAPCGRAAWGARSPRRSAFKLMGRDERVRAAMSLHPATRLNGRF